MIHLKNITKYFLLLTTSIAVIGCANCETTNEVYTTLTNTFANEVEVTFRYELDTDGSYRTMTETIPANETKRIRIFIATGKQISAGISAACEADQITEYAEVEFSKETLSLYTICSRGGNNPDDGIRILPIGSTCGEGSTEITEGY